MSRWRTMPSPGPTNPGPGNGNEYLRRPWRSAKDRIVPILLIAAVVFSLLSLVLGNRGLAQLWELAWRQRELESELTVLERDAANLRWELGESGTMAVERPAREKFHMQRPGEIVYYFPREGTIGADARNRGSGLPESPELGSESGGEATAP